MSYEDMTLTCRDCGQEFIFTAGEQEFYAQKGFLNNPTRCPECRHARKDSASRRGQGERVQTTVVCASCGATTTVPFVPRGDRPVYCSDCFHKMREP